MKLSILKTKLSNEVSAVPTELAQPYLPYLDGLRGVAIIIVILSHCLKENPYFDVLGEVGVEIFFVLSGFLITTLLFKEKIKNGHISLKLFYIRRALRIMPVAYLFLLVLLILNVCFALGVTPVGFLASALYIKNIPIPNSADWYSGHFWSLSIEEQFYLFFPFLLVLNLNRYTLLISLLVIVLPIIGLLAVNKVGIFYTNTAIHALVFLLNSVFFGSGTVSILVGSLCAILVFKEVVVIDRLWNNYFLSFALFLLAVTIGYKESVLFIPHISRLFFSTLIAWIILLNLKQEKNLFSTILGWSAFKQIGILSYSLYIWQQLFTHNQPWKNAFPYADSLALNLLVLYGVATASYYLYEQRFLVLKNKFKQAPPKRSLVNAA
ncbi:acyltransferase [Hymenobacter setariae]|uniref:Acyltransferase n=1 Tax=Hymenobacter setariae TaxID=2594794 RepID=A0A558BYD4_9BACT|nr:acyltransferase [Hymenobacter setariae]TVT41526.1 acyltransferase [Hymenobacter setariae]